MWARTSRQKAAEFPEFNRTRMGFGARAPGDMVKKPKDLRGITGTAGGDCGLVSPACPGIAPRAPLNKTRLYRHRAAGGLPLAGAPQYDGPRPLAPYQALSLTKVSGPKACFLRGKIEVMQSGTQGVRRIRPPKLPLDEVLQYLGTPAARGIARRLRTRFDPCCACLVLCGVCFARHTDGR